MVRSEVATETAEMLGIDPEAFQSRVQADAETLKNELDAGTFDNRQGIIGFEYEFYAVSDPETSTRGEGGETRLGALQRVPRGLLELIGFEKELGLHNAEMCTSPQPMNRHGLAAQEAEIASRLAAALDSTSTEGIRLVSDGLWTIPPAGETARGYLTDSVDDGDVTVATNMSAAARYHAMANTGAPAGMRIEAPNVTLQADTVMPESLITSIQPHYQVPYARDIGEYFRYAIRIAAPLLALGANSPFFPPDLYDDGVTAEEVLADAWAEHRISVFETVLNAEGVRKVKFPKDIDGIEDAIDRIAEDRVFVPMPVERGERFDDQFAAFRTKHGTYWRWVRPVFGGATRSEANARIEFRPIPGQPTVRDAVAFQAAFAGLIEGMHARDHPVADLDWRDARSNFYAAMRDGLSASLSWITADGDPTTDPGLIYADLLEAARTGLEMRGLSEGEIDRYLDPLRLRVDRGVTPAGWKRREVRRRVGEGDDLETAIRSMQQAYISRQSETLIRGAFADWPDG
jgi:hypothetical protein